MTKTDLKRELGLIETVSIAMGAMVGSGIFILPGVAFIQIGGNAMVLAFLVAGLLTIPAAISAAELGSAIPEDGGSYVYVQKGMGSVLGTIAGVGNWFMLSFKTALALVGGVPYLIFLFPRIQDMGFYGFEPIVLLAVALSILFTLVNLFSTTSAGQAQNWIVLIMVVSLGILTLGSIPTTLENQPSPNSFTDFSWGSFISVVGLVFVSYAGVIKVTSIAEEIKNPEKNIPRSIILSLAITTIIYVTLAYIIITTIDINSLTSVSLENGGLSQSGEGAIIAIVANETLGRLGAILIVLSAILALASTANSGILSASRYPFSMSRDSLAPKRLNNISHKWGTPVESILITGGLLVILVIFFPVDKAARFGGAFQIIIFMLVNLTVIGFRESQVDYYDPDYESLFYPYLQIFGIISGAILLLKIGPMALLGATTITMLSLIYYFTYVRRQEVQKSAVQEGALENVIENNLTKIKEILSEQSEYNNIVIVLRENTSERCRDKMIKVADNLSPGNITVIETKHEFSKSFDESHPTISNSETPPWLANTLNENQVQYFSIRSENVKEAIINFSAYNNADLIMHEYGRSPNRRSTLRPDIEWILEHSPCQAALIKPGEKEESDISLTSIEPTFSPIEIKMVKNIYEKSDKKDKNLNLLQVINPEDSDREKNIIGKYHKDIISLLENTQINSKILESEKPIEALLRFTSDEEMIISEIKLLNLRSKLLGRKKLDLVEATNSTCILVYSRDREKYKTFMQKIIIKYFFRNLT